MQPTFSLEIIFISTKALRQQSRQFGEANPSKQLFKSFFKLGGFSSFLDLGQGKMFPAALMRTMIFPAHAICSSFVWPVA
jgi:hypothetical protein